MSIFVIPEEEEAQREASFWGPGCQGGSARGPGTGAAGTGGQEEEEEASEGLRGNGDGSELAEGEECHRRPRFLPEVVFSSLGFEHVVLDKDRNKGFEPFHLMGMNIWKSAPSA